MDKNTVEHYEKLLDIVKNNNVEGVIQNNLVFAKWGHSTEHTNEQLKMIDESLESEYRMTHTQRKAILHNKLCLLLKKGRTIEAQKLIKEIEAGSEVTADR